MELLHGSYPYENCKYEDMITDIEDPNFPEFLNISDRLKKILQKMLTVEC